MLGKSIGLIFALVGTQRDAPAMDVRRETSAAWHTVVITEMSLAGSAESSELRREDSVMVILETKEWAETTFGPCELGDERRNRRLVRVAQDVVARPDGSTPEQTESWGDCKAAYRLFNEEDVTFDRIIAPHCRQVREGCEQGSVKLIINDTTEIDYGRNRKATGLGRTGNGSGRGFFLHTAMMVDAADGRVDGLAGQILFYRKPKVNRGAKNTQRRSGDRESVVWGNLVDQVGPAPAGVKWVHVDDRGADDFEVFRRIQAVENSCVIRAARLNRRVKTVDGQSLPLKELLNTLPGMGVRELTVKAKKELPKRTATVELRFSEIRMPTPRVLTPWLKKHRSNEDLTLWVVELREVNAPKGIKGLHWVLYTFEPVTTVDMANTVISWYEIRPTIEDYHKAFKTGCSVQERYYATSDRLERVTALLSIVAVRLMQVKTAALETPDRPAREVAPVQWVRLVQTARRKPVNENMTIYQFIRALAGLGGHLGRKSDGEPGWITVWRGFEKLMLIVKGENLAGKKCG